MWVPYVFVASAILAGSAISAAACNESEMVGRWRCEGESCDRTVSLYSDLFREKGGGLKWRDGRGAVADVGLSVSETILTFPNGTLKGRMKDRCRMMVITPTLRAVKVG
jgi:hypothetical protein